jgi:hypothetical protein
MSGLPSPEDFNRILPSLSVLRRCSKCAAERGTLEFKHILTRLPRSGLLNTYLLIHAQHRLLIQPLELKIMNYNHNSHVHSDGPGVYRDPDTYIDENEEDFDAMEPV